MTLRKREAQSFIAFEIGSQDFYLADPEPFVFGQAVSVDISPGQVVHAVELTIVRQGP